MLVQIVLGLSPDSVFSLLVATSSLSFSLLHFCSGSLILFLNFHPISHLKPPVSWFHNLVLRLEPQTGVQKYFGFWERFLSQVLGFTSLPPTSDPVLTCVREKCFQFWEAACVCSFTGLNSEFWPPLRAAQPSAVCFTPLWTLVIVNPSYIQHKFPTAKALPDWEALPCCSWQESH